MSFKHLIATIICIMFLTGCHKKSFNKTKQIEVISEEKIKNSFDITSISQEKIESIQMQGCIILPGAVIKEVFDYPSLIGCDYSVCSNNIFDVFNLIFNLIESDGWLISGSYQENNQSFKITAIKPHKNLLSLVTKKNNFIKIKFFILS